jgi:hypothetical protein
MVAAKLRSAQRDLFPIPGNKVGTFARAQKTLATLARYEQGGREHVSPQGSSSDDGGTHEFSGRREGAGINEVMDGAVFGVVVDIVPGRTDRHALNCQRSREIVIQRIIDACPPASGLFPAIDVAACIDQDFPTPLALQELDTFVQNVTRRYAVKSQFHSSAGSMYEVTIYPDLREADQRTVSAPFRCSQGLSVTLRVNKHRQDRRVKDPSCVLVTFGCRLHELDELAPGSSHHPFAVQDRQVTLRIEAGEEPFEPSHVLYGAVKKARTTPNCLDVDEGAYESFSGLHCDGSSVLPVKSECQGEETAHLDESASSDHISPSYRRPSMTTIHGNTHLAIGRNAYTLQDPVSFHDVINPKIEEV